MTVPDEIRDRLKAQLWEAADKIEWIALGPVEKSQQYKNWAHDPQIGGTLSNYMNVRHVRQYIKDTLLKKYPEMRHADAMRPLRLLQIDANEDYVRNFSRPHGRQLSDGRVVTWGRAADWKSILMATHERAFRTPGSHPYGVVLLQCQGKFGADEARAVVQDAATKLGIQAVIWDC